MNQHAQSSIIINRGTKAPINIPPYVGLAKSEINATTGDCCARCTAVYPPEWLGLACLLNSDSTLYGVYGLVHHTGSGTQKKRNIIKVKNLNSTLISSGLLVTSSCSISFPPESPETDQLIVVRVSATVYKQSTVYHYSLHSVYTVQLTQCIHSKVSAVRLCCGDSVQCQWDSRV